MEKTDPKELFKRYWYVLALVLIVWTAFWLRSFPARFGELQALDPFYFYRMGQDIVDTGNLVEWDYMRYYPRGVSPYETEYAGTTFGPVYVYLALSGIGVINMPFLHWAIIWPALLGALAVLAMYFVGSEMFGKKAGLFSAFFLATVPAFITRTSAGFYEKEPIAGLFIILSVYFFVRAFKRDSWISGILGGLSLAVVSLSWGGVQYIYLLFTGFMLFLFAMNAVFLVLDYLFKGFSDTLQRLDRWFGPRMIKAYIPLILLGTLIQQIFPHHASLTSTGVLGSYLTMAILAARFAVARFKLLPKEQTKYFIPGALMVSFMVLITGSMFDDTLSGTMSSLVGYMTFEKAVHGTTVAENAPGTWDNVFSMTGASFANNLLPQLQGINQFLSLGGWILGFMFLGVGLLLYRFYRTHEWVLFFPVIWLTTAIFGVFYFVRLIFLVGPPAALLGGFFLAWVVERIPRMKVFQKSEKTGRKLNVVTIGVVVFAGLVLLVNFTSAYVYSLNLGPSICFPRGSSNNPFDVEPCVTFDEEGNEVLAGNQPWYEAMSFLSKETPEDSVILSWWDFGYWFQTRGNRASVADGGNLFISIDNEIADWYVSPTSEWDKWWDWLRKHDVDYILMDYTLPGKYGAISKIASEGEQIVGFLQFQQSGAEPKENGSVYIFKADPYEIWMPMDDQGQLTGPPMFLVQQGGQYLQKMYINRVCTENGITRVGNESQSIEGCVSFSDYGVNYIPSEAENTIFTNLMFMKGNGLPVEIVFDNQLIKVYRVIYPGEEVATELSE